MDLTGDELLPGSALSADDDRDPGRRDLADDLEDLDQPRIAAHEPVRDPAIHRRAGVRAGPRPRVTILEDARQQPTERLKVERFDQEIPGALAHGDRDRREIVVSGHDHDIG